MWSINLPVVSRRCSGAANQNVGATNFSERFLERKSMTETKVLCLMALGLTMVMAPRAEARVQTDVPAVVAGAKPVAVEHIKVHGAALEGNLEGDAVDRDVLVFLPPSYSEEKSRRY